MARRTFISVERFARETPSAPAERIECVACGEEFLGGPASGETCPECAR